MNETKAREAICAIGGSIFERGLTAGSSGNISMRVEDGWLMTPTNFSLGRLDPARLSKLDDNGRVVVGDPPTKESFLHRVMYEERSIAVGCASRDGATAATIGRTERTEASCGLQKAASAGGDR